MLRNSGLVVLVALVLAGCEDPEGGIFGDPVTPIKVTRPNGGEIWVFGDTETITWTAVGVTADNVIIDYFDGVNWTRIDPGVTISASAGSHLWTIPDEDSKLCRVRVLEDRPGGLWDESDADFRIAQLVYIDVTSPDGGEVWLVGDTEKTITWIAPGLGGNVVIDYSTTGAGGPWTNIDTVPATDESCPWNGSGIPNEPSTICLVRVVGGGGVEDESDDVFEIKAP